MRYIGTNLIDGLATFMRMIDRDIIERDDEINGLDYGSFVLCTLNTCYVPVLF
jgi:hypothetical protein